MKRSGVIHPDTGTIVNVVNAEDNQTTDAVTGYDLTDLPCERGDNYTDGLIVAKPAPLPSADELRRQEFSARPDRQELLDRLRTATPDEIDDWVDNQVTTLASARAMFKRILLMMT